MTCDKVLKLGHHDSIDPTFYNHVGPLTITLAYFKKAKGLNNWKVTVWVLQFMFFQCEDEGSVNN